MEMFVLIVLPPFIFKLLIEHIPVSSQVVATVIFFIAWFGAMYFLRKRNESTLSASEKANIAKLKSSKTFVWMKRIWWAYFVSGLIALLLVGLMILHFSKK